MPKLFDNNSIEQWQAEGSLDMAQRANGLWKKQLAEYVAPPLDPAVDEALALPLRADALVLAVTLSMAATPLPTTHLTRTIRPATNKKAITTPAAIRCSGFNRWISRW